MPKGEDITTKFKVDISDLKKGITEANNQIKLANAQFKAASASMDDWANSSAGLQAKITQLQSVLTAQNSKLKSYKDQLAAVENAETKNGQKADELKLKLQQLSDQGVSKTSAEYKKYQTALTNVEKEQLANKTAADNLRITILNQQAAVNSTEKEIRNYNTSLNNLENEAEQAGNSIDDLSDDMNKTNTASSKLSDGFTVMKGALANLVADGIRTGISALKEFAGEMITTAANVKAEASMFEQTFGDMGDEASAAIKRVADSSGILETRLNVAGAKIYAFAKSNGATATQAMALMENALNASADSAAYYDKSLDETTETMMSFLKGNYANDAALGVSATEFTRNAKAAELFGKKYNDLTEFQKQETLLKMVTDSQKAAGAFGQAARESDGWENVMGNLKETWRQFQAQVGTPFLEALIPIIKKVTASFVAWTKSVNWEHFGIQVTKTIQKIVDVFNWFVKNKTTVVAAVSAMITAFAVTKIISFTTALVSAVSGIGLAIKAFAAAPTVIAGMNAALKALNITALANPYVALATAIAAVVAALAIWISKSDETKNQLKAEYEEIKKESEVVAENKKAWDDLNKAKQTNIDNGMSEMQHYQSLYDELTNLVDANGKVKEGYEGRASFITSTLSEALGIEVKMVGGVIKNYKKLTDSFDSVMAKKKAMIILEAQEETYKKALTDKANALRAMNKLQEDLKDQEIQRNQLLQEMEEANNIFARQSVSEKLDLLNKQTEETRKQYDTNEDLLEEYTFNIGTYENNMSLFHEEKYDEMSQVTWDYIKNTKDSGDQQKTLLENQIADTQVELSRLLELKKKSNSDIYDNQIEAAKNQINKAKEDLRTYTSTVENGNKNITQEWLKGVSDQVSAATSKNVEFRKSGNNNIQMYANGVKSGEPRALGEMEDFAKNAINEINQEKGNARSAGKNIIDGTKEGIQNQNAQASVFNAIWKFGSKILSNLRSSLKEHSPSKASEEDAVNLLIGFNNGVDKKENLVLKRVRDFGQNVIGTLQDELNQNVEISNIKNNLQNQLSKAKSSLSNVNVPTISATTGIGGTNNSSSNVVNNFTQIINSPKQPSRVDIYRDTENLLDLKDKGGN